MRQADVRFRRRRWPPLVLSILLAAIAASRGASQEAKATDTAARQAAREALLEHGLRLSRERAILQSEVATIAALKRIQRSRKDVTAARKGLDGLERKQAELRSAAERLLRLNVQLNGRLASLGSKQVLLNNKLVAAIKANQGQLRLLSREGERLAAQVGRFRQEHNQAREMYVQQILDARRHADQTQRRYQELADDQEVAALLENVRSEQGKPIELRPSPSFRSSLKRLGDLEETVITEAIPLRRAAGGTFYVTVVVNGQHAQEMVLDSGAAVVSLSAQAAADCGVVVKPSDPELTLQLADGSRISARRVQIPSVRVGKFTVENVNAAVLGPQAVGAEPLLGMSFLENFAFEIKAAEGSLHLTRVQMP